MTEWKVWPLECSQHKWGWTTDGRQTKGNHNSSPLSNSCTGELTTKTVEKLCKFQNSSFAGEFKVKVIKSVINVNISKLSFSHILCFLSHRRKKVFLVTDVRSVLDRLHSRIQAKYTVVLLFPITLFKNNSSIYYMFSTAWQQHKYNNSV